MHHVATAIYRTHAVAATVRDELKHLGIGGSDIHVLPETDDRATPGARRSVDGYNRQLHDLALPEDDVRTYQNAIADGDYLVSVEVDDDDQLDKVKAIMRRPEEGHDIAARDEHYRDAPYEPYEGASGAASTDEYRARRAEPGPGEDNYVRGYSRSGPVRGTGRV